MSTKMHMHVRYTLLHTVVLHINTTACSRVIPAKVGQFVRRTKDTIIARNKVGRKQKQVNCDDDPYFTPNLAGTKQHNLINNIS